MSYTDVIAYVGDGCIMCPTCAVEALVADVRSALPYSAKVLDRYDDETVVQVYARRTQRAPKLYRYHEDRTIESMKVGFNPDREPDVRDLRHLLVINGETEIGACTDADFSDALDGEHCECGAEISEPMPIGDVVSDTWPDWAREVFNAWTLSIDEEVFFWDVAEQLGESSRQAFYDANRNSGRGQSAWAIEEAIGKVLGRYIHEAQRVQRGRNKLDYSGVMYPLKAS